MQEQKQEAPVTTDSIDQFDTQSFFKENLGKADDGSLTIVGDEHSPMELALLETEKRRRGSQASTSREKARADQATLELSKVKDGIQGLTPQTMTVDEALKYSDPDEYIKQSLEAQSAPSPYQEVFNTANKQAIQEANQMTMESVLEQHNIANPNRQVTADMMELDLPPRLIREFGQGQMSPQDFLGQAADLLYRPTETYNEPIASMPNLGDVAGQSSPTDDGSNDKLMENYSTAVF